VGYNFASFLFVVYFLAMMLLTTVPGSIGQRRMDYIGWRILQLLGAHGVQLDFSALERVSNVAMFIPFGIYTVVWLSRHWSRTSLLARALLAAIGGLLVSGTIESAQMLIPGRFPDTSDLIMNSSGALIGGVIAVAITAGYRGLKWLFADT